MWISSKQLNISTVIATEVEGNPDYITQNRYKWCNYNHALVDVIFVSSQLQNWCHTLVNIKF